MNKVLKIAGGVLAAGVVAYCAVVLYVSIALAKVMYPMEFDET